MSSNQWIERFTSAEPLSDGELRLLSKHFKTLAAPEKKWFMNDLLGNKPFNQLPRHLLEKHKAMYEAGIVD